MLKLSTELYTLAVSKGYPEEFAELEGFSVPLNDHAEEVEYWLREEKGLIPRVHPISRRNYASEVRAFTKFGATILKYNKDEITHTYDKARLKSIEIALNQL